MLQAKLVSLCPRQLTLNMKDSTVYDNKSKIVIVVLKLNVEAIFVDIQSVGFLNNIYFNIDIQIMFYDLCF